jgi:hypothetical protein
VYGDVVVMMRGASRSTVPAVSCSERQSKCGSQLTRQPPSFQTHAWVIARRVERRRRARGDGTGPRKSRARTAVRVVGSIFFMMCLMCTLVVCTVRPSVSHICAHGPSNAVA